MKENEELNAVSKANINNITKLLNEAELKEK